LLLFRLFSENIFFFKEFSLSLYCKSNNRQMATLFFILLLIPLLYEIRNIQEPELRREHSAHLKEYSRQQKDLTIPKGDKVKFPSIAIIELFYALMTILGCLLASQWLLFASLFILGALISLFKKVSPNTLYIDTLTRIDAAASSILILYIILNHFHHLDYISLRIFG